MDGSPSLQVRRFRRRCLQLESELEYPSLAELQRIDVQEYLYEQLFNDDGPAFPLPRRYQLRVLTALVRRVVENVGDQEEHDVSDRLLSGLARLLAEPLPSEEAESQRRCYVTYTLSALQGPGGDEQNTPTVTLLESRAVISANGTTGLRTWEAALHLGEHLCRRPALVRGKRVLELGAGTGYLSVLCAKHLGAAHFVASDGSDDVLRHLPDNLFINGLQNSPAVSVAGLKWGHALPSGSDEEYTGEQQVTLGGGSVDMVLGADITFDGRLVPPLVATLCDLLDAFPAARILIAATERNRQTFDSFCNAAGKARLAVEMMPWELTGRQDQMGPFYGDSVAIHICEVSRPS